MKPFPLARVSLALLGVATLTALLVELLAAYVNAQWRVPMYAGEAGGLLVGFAGLPFAAKLAKVELRAQAEFWKWWALGLMMRLVLLLPLALILAVFFRDSRLAAVLTLVGVYLAGMFVEAAWLSQHFCSESTAVESR